MKAAGVDFRARVRELSAEGVSAIAGDVTPQAVAEAARAAQALLKREQSSVSAHVGAFEGYVLWGGLLSFAAAGGPAAGQSQEARG